MPKKLSLAGMEVELSEGVHLPTERRKRPSCYILDTADRLSALLGTPAKKLYLDLVAQHEDWSHSEEEMLEAVFHQEYVYPTQVMLWRNNLEIPYGPGIEAPAEFQERINPEVFIEAMRTEALDLWQALMLELPEVRESVGRMKDMYYYIPIFRWQYEKKLADFAGSYLPRLRRMRELEFYLTYDQIEAVEVVIHAYMYDIFEQRYYL